MESDLEKINNSGQMTGYYVDQNDMEHAFVYDLNTQTFTTLDPPGSIFSAAGGINNLGAVVGSYGTTADGGLAFLSAGGHFKTLKFPTSLETTPGDINDSGEIVGSVSSPGGSLHRAFLFQSGKFARFLFPGSSSTSGYGVNNAGMIVGAWGDNTNVGHGFIRTP
jgi:uncharacterized membrane protein